MSALGDEHRGQAPRDSTPGPAGPRAVHLDHFDKDLRRGALYELYREIEGCPVVRSDAHGGFWVMNGYAEVRDAATEWKVFSSADGVFHPGIEHRSVALEQDPPEHGPFRKLYSDLLSRHNVARAEPRIREIALRLVEDLAERGRGDFIEEVAAKLPVEVIAHLLGLSDEMAAQLRALTEETWRHFEDDPHAPHRLMDALMNEVHARRDDPSGYEDFIATLCRSTIDGVKLGDDQLANFLLGAVVAGHETTMNASGHLVRALAEDPAMQRRLRLDPALVPHAVEESLRRDAPVQAFFRTVTEHCTRHGVGLEPGDKVMLAFGAANRDPAVFGDPERFDLGRENKRHLAFGWGIHRCAGAHLAQVELRILVETLLAYDLRLDGESGDARLSGGHHMGLSRLPVALERAPEGGPWN